MSALRVRTLFECVADARALRDSWDDVAGGQLEGETSQALERFAEDLDEKLAQLAEALRGGTFQPGTLWEVRVPKRDGDERVLHVPTVKDRVVERAVLNVVAPLVDPLLGPSSFGYRTGIGVTDAVQAVAQWRDAGYGWVLRSDVHDCFPSIPRDHALRLLCAVLPDDSLNDLIARLMGRRGSNRRGRYEVEGLAQGASLSPLAANLVLTALDEAVLACGLPIVRFADDFVVLGRNRDDCWEAARRATNALKGIGMRLSPDKTEVTSFDTGFTFVGEDFGPRFPPVVDAHRVVEPAKRVLYAGVDGGRVRKEQGRILVESPDDRLLLSVPMSHIERIVLFGAVGLSAGVRAWSCTSGVDVVYISRRGSYVGTQSGSHTGTHVERLRAQLAVADDVAASMAFARVVVAAKLSHQATVLRRFPDVAFADEARDAVAHIRNCIKLAQLAQTPAELMGIEGTAARAYFEVFGQLVPSPLRFALRSRRPPMDVVNSALGYGYALLLGECVAALRAAGLDPAIGMLHADDDRRQSLALDFMEELRPYVVDRVVLSIARRGSLTVEHGRPGDSGGTMLTRAGKRVLVDAFEKQMLRTTAGASPGFSGTVRRLLYRQAQRLAAFVEAPQTGWAGLSWR